MEIKNELIGKKVKLIFQDFSKILTKLGEVLNVDNNFVTLQLNTHKELIPHSRILRMEVIP